VLNRPPETVIPRRDPRARTLLGLCLGVSCGFFLVELVTFLLLQAHGGPEPAYRVLEVRYRLFSLGKESVPVYAGVGVLIHSGIAALMSAALAHTWLRNRRLALSAVLLVFLAFQGALVALAMGGS
jgi:hypothetical protein